jgi:phosphate transport system substrate-binding protein
MNFKLPRAVIAFMAAALLGGAAVAQTPAQPQSQLSFDSVKPPAATESKTLTGVGGTFPKPLYEQWFAAYKGRMRVDVQYKADGSSAGIQAASNQTADFGASDAPLSDEQMAVDKNKDLLHIPTAFGGIVLAYNLPGVTAKLNLTADTIALIYEGQIRFWDDDRLVADNKGIDLPHQGIIVLHRAEGSGTTFGFTTYLSSASPNWRSRIGAGTAVEWPVGMSAAGNDGVASLLARNPYSIGYVELNFAMDRKLSYAKVKNAKGVFVDPTLKSVSEAASAAAPTGLDLRLNVVNTSSRDAYPIVTGTYILVHKSLSADKLAQAQALTRLLWWMTHDGQAANEGLNYARVPDSITAKSEQLIKSITAGSQAAYTGN